MIRAIAALALLASSATAVTAAASTAKAADTLLSSSAWWEKVTVTMSGDGNTRSCSYESSLKPTAPQACDVTNAASGTKVGEATGAKSEFTKITFERRFSPGAEPEVAKLAAGDTLLGGQVMALAIDAHGEVKRCQIVASSSGIKPEYGCDEAAAERFDASVGATHQTPREGYMTILVYGHPEHMV